MIYFKKFFKIPGPADLGMSNSNNAMPSSLFGRNRDGRPTWEEYYAHVKVEYPVRYFFARTVPAFWNKMWANLTFKPKKFHYWFISHFIPSSKYHLVDIRQPGEYDYGWCDTDMRMVYALFSLLVSFVEKEVDNGYYVPSEEEAALDDGTCNSLHPLAKQQLANYKEFMAIYNYWKTDRHMLNSNNDAALTAWSSMYKDKSADEEEIAALWARVNETEKLRDDTLDEMMIRLIKIRHCLWT